MDPRAQELIARLRRNPDDGDAYAQLRALYHQQGEYASLANLLEGWASRSADPQAAAAAFYEAAELCDGYLDDRPRAISLLERALEREPLLFEASQRLEEIFEANADHRRLVDVLERRSNALSRAGGDPRLLAAIEQQLGEIWEQRIGRVDKAIAHYRKAYETDPSLVTAIYAAREIYRQAGNFKAAAGLYDLEVEAEPDPRRKVALLREVAHMRAETLGDLDGSLTSLERAQTQAPTDLAVMHDLATLLLRRAERSTDGPQALVNRQRAADLLYRMAQSVPTEHAVAYAEAALDATPDHDGAMELLEERAPQIGRDDVLPVRWVGYLSAAPPSPASDRRRRLLGEAYLSASQLEDAIVCFEPLLERGDSEAAEKLVSLYRRAGRERDVVRALSVAVAGLPAEQRVPRLREIVTILLEQGAIDDARERAREILAIDAADPEALGFLEDDCRKRSAWDELRDLLQGAARSPALSPEARKERLREVAALSQTKLSDPAGAVNAWRAIVALDPADADARTTLAKLLEETGRWDELVQLLEREALTLTEPEAKAELYRRLAHIHRDRRSSLMEAIEAFRQLRELRPGDEQSRDELCDALVEVGAFLEAVPLLRQRIESARNKESRAPLLAILARILDEQVGDEEGAFEAATRLLDDDPGNRDALDRMERIDRGAKRWDRLVETLSYRAEVTPKEERAAVFVTMAEIADRELTDLDRAAEYYGKALDLAPGDPATLDAVCDVYDRAERFRDLVTLLKDRAKAEQDVRAKAELYRRIARTLDARVRNEDGAAEAWSEVLTAGPDEEALRFLRGHAGRREDLPRLEDVLGRLATVVESMTERRELLLERASVLAEGLARPADAIAVLREVVEKIDETHMPALAKLAELCEATHDLVGLSAALERQLALTEDDGLRVPIARRLADLFEKELDDRPRAIDALYAWADADLTEPEPQRRLVVLLERAERWENLVASLDALSGIEQDERTISEVVRRAARLAIDKLGDVDGAWERLTSRVADGDDEAEVALRELATEVARGEMLATFYVSLAQRTTEIPEQRRRWLDAASALEELSSDPVRSLEAVLRAFALDLDDVDVLGEVDRLASAAGAWPRLAQVYDTLVRRATTEEQKSAALLRHAALLDAGASDPSAALDQVLRACAVAPGDLAAIARAEELAPRAQRAEELFVVYDRMRARAADEAGRVDALLRAAKLADIALRDRDRALAIVAQAVVATGKKAELLSAIEATMRELDEARQDLGSGAARKALVDVYRTLAERVAEDAPQTGAEMLRRAARIHLEDLDDDAGGFKYLCQATSLAPGDASLVEELEQLAERTGRLEELERHFAELVKEAFDQGTAALLLERRGRILEVELERFSDAADVWAQILALRRGDPEIPRRLRHCLRRAGRHQDVLLALDREIERTTDAQRQAELYKDVAKTWEEDLGNKWEALDAWKEVLSRVPGDADAVEAVKRLGHATRRLSASELADGASSSEIVLPEHVGAVAKAPSDAPAAAARPGRASTPPPDPGGRLGSTFDDETDLESADDFLASDTGRHAIEDAMAFVQHEAAPKVDPFAKTATPEHVLPGAPGSAVDFTSEEHTSDGDTGETGAPAAPPAPPEPVASTAPEAEIFRDPDSGELTLDTGEVDLADVEVVAADAVESVDTGEVILDEDAIEELDVDEILDEKPKGRAAASIPPPVPPRRSNS